MKSLKYLLLTLLGLLICPNLFARDINLDEIYIKSSSSYIKKLRWSKLDTYKKIDAQCIERDVIFSEWSSGGDIVYIKEKSNINRIYKYQLRSKRSIEICSIKGIITIARITNNGRYLILKRLKQKGGVIPRGERIIIDLQTKIITKEESASSFLDFSIIAGGDSIIYEDGAGFIELIPDSGVKRLLVKESDYSDIALSNNPSIAYISPDKQKTLVINGSGGRYSAIVLYGDSSININGITSSTEVFWINNHEFVMRRGSPGYYSVELYNINLRKMTTLLRESFNTNITFSAHPRILSFLKEGIVKLFFINIKKLISPGIEGEDISFSPDGRRFTSLFYKRLYIVNLSNIEKRQIELKRSWKSILLIYRDLKGRTEEFENEYSLRYIHRKIEVYQQLLGM
ncbi:MAG: hypothetical protein SVZ03_12700 [Spirochaetota bacterium]|nr:hypothetical protein [Spirochaetota bacterium]